MRILLMQLVLPVVCYFIGVEVGKRVERNSVEIHHVEYTKEQLGYDK